MMGKVGQGDDFKGSVVLAQGFIYTEIWNFWKQRYWEKWSHKKNGLSSGIEELVAVEMHSQSCLASTRDWKVRVAQLCFSRLSSRKGQWICNGNSYQLGHCGEKMWWINNCILQNTDVYMYLQALRCVFCISHTVLEGLIDWLIDDRLYSAILRSLEQTHCACMRFCMSD